MALKKYLGRREYEKLSAGFIEGLDLNKNEFVAGRAALEKTKKLKTVGGALQRLMARYVSGVTQHHGLGRNLRGEPVMTEEEMVEALKGK